MRLLMAITIILLTTAADVLPNNAESPGAINPNVTQDNIHQTICVKGWSQSVRPLDSFTEPLKLHLLVEHAPGDNPRQFELDHRVPIEDGGCPTCVANLWLQPWRDSHHHVCQPAVLMDAACKDRLENLVHRRICAGQMSLATGQAIFLGDWITAYGQYVPPR
jgi:hypothetical protein